MVDVSALIALIGAALLLGAWREYDSRNRRDAALLGGVGTMATLAAAAIWLI